MASNVSRSVLLVLVFVAASFVVSTAVNENCVYTIYVRTGSIWRGGTDSTISVEIYDTSYTAILISNLTQWGGNLMGSDHDYFERGALDIFSGLGDCLANPICGLNLTSDGSGASSLFDGPGWYVDYLEVTITGAHLDCSQGKFTVERWLATDTYPFTLTYEADVCADYALRNPKECGQSALR